MKFEVESGKLTYPDRITIYGPGGVGKSTLATLAPNPVFIDCDNGTGKLNVKRAKYAEGVYVPPTLEAFNQSLDWLLSEKHEFGSLVVDGLGVLEQLIQTHVAVKQQEKNFEEIGWGKGPKFALLEWRKVLDKLNSLRTKRKMQIVLIAHYQIKTFKNPEGQDYDRYSLNLDPLAGKLIYEWSDTMAFARFEDIATKAAGGEKQAQIGVSTERRYLATRHSAAFDAKARENVPKEINLDQKNWSNVWSLLTGQAAKENQKNG